MAVWCCSVNRRLLSSCSAIARGLPSSIKSKMTLHHVYIPEGGRKRRGELFLLVNPQKLQHHSAYCRIGQIILLATGIRTAGKWSHSSEQPGAQLKIPLLCFKGNNEYRDTKNSFFHSISDNNNRFKLIWKYENNEYLVNACTKFFFLKSFDSLFTITLQHR